MIEKNNKLIAKFMGWEVKKEVKTKFHEFDKAIDIEDAGLDFSKFKYDSKQDYFWWNELYETETVNKETMDLFVFSTEASDLKFHSDWNWIMKVIEKLESLGWSYGYLKENNRHIINFRKGNKFQSYKYSDKNSRIHSVYLSILKFIKQKNE